MRVGTILQTTIPVDGVRSPISKNACYRKQSQLLPFINQHESRVTPNHDKSDYKLLLCGMNTLYLSKV